jgi:protein SCO1/2
VSVVLAAALLAGTVSGFRRGGDLPVHWPLPAFALVDQDGRPQTLGGLRGRPWIADFIFTRCGGVCPLLTARVAKLQPRLPAGTRIVSFTVDPEHDQPAVLARYARDVGAGPHWLFLTGPREDLYRLATDGFKLAAMELPAGDPRAADGPFLHSAKLVLVDGEGRVRGYYDSEDEAARERLLADLARLGS